MTEMVYGTVPARAGEPVLPRWWRTIDKWSLSGVLVLFGIGLLLGLAASVPLAEKNGLDPFYYVTRQALFGGVAIVAMLFASMMSPDLVRRLGVVGGGRHGLCRVAAGEGALAGCRTLARRGHRTASSMVVR